MRVKRAIAALFLVGGLLGTPAVVVAQDAAPAVVIDAAPATAADAGPAPGSLDDITGKAGDLKDAVVELRDKESDKPRRLLWVMVFGSGLWLLIAVGKNKVLGDKSRWIPVIVAFFAVPATFLTEYATGIGWQAAAEIVSGSGVLSVFIQQAQRAFTKKKK